MSDQHSFDGAYWHRMWQDPGSMAAAPPNPYVVRETPGLTPGTALDAGCGAGAEATWLAARGWRVTGVDLAPNALTRARERAAVAGVSVAWVEADLAAWEPDHPFDLVVSSYAHASIPQLDLYARIAGWVAPGGTLLLVGHQDHGHAHHGPEPAEATVTSDDMVGVLGDGWSVVTAAAERRTVGAAHQLHDIVVRAVRVRWPHRE